MSAKLKTALKGFYSKHPIICHLLFICLAGLILIWGSMIYLEKWTLHGNTAVVPEIKHHSYTEAREMLEANRLTIEISDSIYDPTFPAGTVIESWPKAGAVVKDGRQVYVTVTAFSPKQVTISMPMTGNVSSRQAISYLRGIGINDIRLKHIPSEFADLVIEAQCGGAPLTVGTVLPITSTVTLTVGSGPDELSESVEVDGDIEQLLENVE